MADAPAQTLRLQRDPRETAAAREYVCAAAAQILGGDDLDSLALLTSEVVTNALVHGGLPVDVSVDLVGASVRVSVTDHHAGTPVVRSAGSFDEGGRGMLLVDALASTWGIDPASAPDVGKTVWFVLP